MREGHGAHLLLLLHGHEMSHHRVGLLLLLLHAKAVHVLLLTQLLHVLLLLLLLHDLLLLLHCLLLLLRRDITPILVLRRGVHPSWPAAAHNAGGRRLLLRLHRPGTNHRIRCSTVSGARMAPLHRLLRLLRPLHQVRRLVWLLTACLAECRYGTADRPARGQGNHLL